MNKSKMPASEREKRSKLTKVVAYDEFVRATVDIRAKKCMNNGKRYRTMYLLHMKNGEKKTIYVPREWEDRAKKWVAKYKEIRKYTEGISDIYLKKIKDRKG